MSNLWQDVTNKDTETNWAIFEVNGDTPVGISSGIGLSPFAEAFDDHKIQWGVLNVYGVDQQDNVTSRRPKYVLVNWVGPRVPAMKRLGALQGKNAITSLLQGVQASIDCNDRTELNMTAIGKTLLQCGGAHKPTHYDFGGGEQVTLTDLGYH